MKKEQGIRVSQEEKVLYLEKDDWMRPTSCWKILVEPEYGKWGFPGDAVVKNPPSNAGDVGWTPGSGRSPEAGNDNPLVLLPGKFHGQRHLVDYSPGGARRVRYDWAQSTHNYDK